jgi:hypothetical protein
MRLMMKVYPPQEHTCKHHTDANTVFDIRNFTLLVMKVPIERNRCFHKLDCHSVNILFSNMKFRFSQVKNSTHHIYKLLLR